MMTLRKFAPPIVSVVIALALLVALVAVALPAQPAAANKVDGYALYTWKNNGITATVNGAGRFVADYGQLECYQTLDVTDAETMTLSFQSSPDNSNWAAVPVWQYSSNVLLADADFADASADGTTFGILMVRGQYVRPVFTLATSNAITDTLRCIAKDASDDIDFGAGALEMTD